MKKCVVCKQRIWFWQKYSTVTNLHGGKYFHNKCQRRYSSDFLSLYELNYEKYLKGKEAAHARYNNSKTSHN